MKAKSIFLTSLILSTLLVGCQNPPKIDLQAELQKRPETTLSWEGEDRAPSITGGFCSDVLCLDSGDPDWSALNFTSYNSTLPLTLTVNSTLSINELTISLKNTDGNTIQNNLDTTEISPKTYQITEAFKHRGQLILSAKIHFTEGGYVQDYFPLEVE